jgi:superfamily II DNA or RNA helicase
MTFRVEFQSATHVSVFGDERLRLWQEQEKVMTPGAEWTQLYKKGKWDGWWRPGVVTKYSDTWELRITRGLLPRVEAALGERLLVLPTKEEQAHILDFVQREEAVWSTLRDYQQEAFLHAAGREWGRIAYATNAGKGAVIALLARYAARRNIPVLILCAEKAVFDALEGELDQWGRLTPFKLKGGSTTTPLLLTHAHVPVTLAMVPSLTRRLNPKRTPPEEVNEWRAWAHTIGMVLLDEADQATAEGWQRILRATKRTRWRLGFSGSFPEAKTYEDWKLEESIGPVLSTIKNMELVARDISARPTVHVLRHDASYTLWPPPEWPTWRALSGPAKRLWAYDKGIVFNAVRHKIIRDLIRPSVPTAIVVNRLEHGHQLAAAIPGSVFLEGATTEPERLTQLEAFKRGEFSVLIVTKILDRGTNRLGFAEDIIFASGEGSTRQTLQRIGRGLRRHNGKQSLRLVDIVDMVSTEALDTGPRSTRFRKVAEYLATAVRQRLELYNSEGFEVVVDG